MEINQELIRMLKNNILCWYPSAGDDLRPLLYLSEQYVSTRDDLRNISPLPRLFVFTDYCRSYFDGISINGLEALSAGTLRNGDYLFDDSVVNGSHFFYKNTKIRVNKIEKINTGIPGADLSLISAYQSAQYGTAYYMDVQITSTDKTKKKNDLGRYSAQILYVFAENSAFAELLLRENISVDFLLRIRYGGAFGGSSYTDGEWLRYAAPKLGVKYFLEETERTGLLQDNDKKIIQKLSEICGALDTKWKGEEFRCVPWSYTTRTIEVSWKKRI